MTITWPEQGALASERVVVVAEATPLEEVLGVELSVIESGLELRYDTDISPPFESVLDTLAWPDGPLELRATAIGRAGQVATDDVMVVVDNDLPEVEILSPSAQDVQFIEDGQVEVILRAQDGSEIDSVTLSVNGEALEPGA